MSLLQRKRERDQKAAEEAARLAEEKRLQELSIHPFIKSGCSRDVRDAYFQGLVFAAVADDDKIDKDERAMLADVGSSLGIQVEEIDEAIASVSALSDDNKLALVEECVNAIKGDENGVKLFCAQFVQVWMSHDHDEDELAEYLRQFAEWGGVDLPEATLNCLRKAIGENEETEEALYELSEWMGEESLKYFAVKRYGDVSQMLARIRKQKAEAEAKAHRSKRVNATMEKLDVAMNNVVKEFGSRESVSDCVLKRISDFVKGIDGNFIDWTFCVNAILDIPIPDIPDIPVIPDIPWLFSGSRLTKSLIEKELESEIRRESICREKVWRLVTLLMVEYKPEDSAMSDRLNLLLSSQSIQQQSWGKRFYEFIETYLNDRVSLVDKDD